MQAATCACNNLGDRYAYGTVSYMLCLIVYSRCTSLKVLIHVHVHDHWLPVADIPMIVDIIHVVD
jgi:hypothetical protein